MSDRGCCYHRSNKLYSLARLLDPRTACTHAHSCSATASMSVCIHIYIYMCVWLCVCTSPLGLWAGELQCWDVVRKLVCIVVGSFASTVNFPTQSTRTLLPVLPVLPLFCSVSPYHFGLHILVFGTQINFLKNCAKTFEPARLHFNFGSKLPNSII